MSNALARKKKRMQPLGYSKSELIGIQRHAKAQSNADYLIEESYYNVRMMAYQALHDKFGFGHKRIIKVEQTIDAYVENAKDGTTGEELCFYLKDKCKIDVREETKWLMDKLTVELQDGYFVEIDSLNHTLRQRYAGQDKDGNEKESVRTIGYFGDMKQCIKALLERYPRELSEKAQISFDEYLELLDKAYTRSEQLVNSLGK